MERGRGKLSLESFPFPLQTSPFLFKDFRLVGRPREGSSFRLRFIIGKKNSLNGGRSGCFFQSAEMTLKRDSIKSKIFEEGGMGFGEGREKLF